MFDNIDWWSTVLALSLGVTTVNFICCVIFLKQHSYVYVVFGTLPITNIFVAVIVIDKLITLYKARPIARPVTTSASTVKLPPSLIKLVDILIADKAFKYSRAQNRLENASLQISVTNTGIGYKDLFYTTSFYNSTLNMYKESLDEDTIAQLLDAYQKTKGA